MILPFPLRMAYADPPYPGQARTHYAADPQCAEVDHVALVRRLNAEFPDGWALSTGSATLLYVLLCILEAEGVEVPRPLPPWASLSAILPAGYRVGAWVKPFASFKPGVNPAYAWEPVIFRGGRLMGRVEPTVRDWVAANITLRRGLAGAKPDGFCFWLFRLLGLRPGDELVDLYPGSGAVSGAWNTYCTQATLPFGEGAA